MSIHNAKLFLQKLAQDPDFASRVNQAQGRDAQMKVAAEAGLSFTAEEARQVWQNLTDDDMTTMVGEIPAEPGPKTRP